MRNWIGCVLACGLLACNDGSNKNGGNGDMAGGGGNFSAVTRSVVVAPGSDCANGGTRVEVGLDNGDGGGTARDGVLQDGEVDKSELVCAPTAATYPTLTKTTPLGAGDLKCPYGGGQTDYGVDDGAGGSTANNGVLETGEIDGTTYTCVPKPANLLVQTTAILAGDPTCPYGGQLIQSGFDDGAPSGTAGNGQLEPDEIDLDQQRCNADPTVLFPAPSGAVGSEVIDGSGGTGAGTASAGSAGSASISVFGGPRAASVELRKRGTISPNIATPTATYTAGVHEASLTSTASPIVIPVSTTAKGSGLYVFGDPTAGAALPLYDGATEIDSLHVGPGVTVVFEDTTSAGRVAVKLAGDLRNEGTLRTKAALDDTRIALSLQAHHVINEASATIDSRGVDLQIFALSGSDGVIVNRGVIMTRGWDDGERDDSKESSPGTGATLILASVSGIYNLGTAVLATRGGKRLDTDLRSASAGRLNAYVVAGSIFNSGSVDGRGGVGAMGSSGGALNFMNGPISQSLREAIDPYELAPSVLYDESKRGAGGWENSGTVDASGGSAQANSYSGAAGGAIFVRSVGGAIRSAGALLANGGDGRVSGCCANAGRGGSIWLGSFTYAGSNGSVVVPEEIGVSGKLQFRGGSLLLSDDFPLGNGGAGGSLVVRLDLTLVGDPESVEPTKGLDSSSPYEVRAFDTTQLGTSTQTARVRLLGFGGGVHLKGGVGSFGGDGGRLEIANDVCSAPAVQCAFLHVGSRLVHSELTHDLSAGASTMADAGEGGYHATSLRSRNNRVAATYDSALIRFDEEVDVSGGSAQGDSGKGGDGGSFFLQSDVGDVHLAKAILALGGDAPKGYEGGRSGMISVAGFGVTVDGDLDADAGANHNNFANTIAVDGYRVAIHGDVKMKSNWTRQINLSAFDTLEVTGDILADSMPGPHNATIRLTAKTATTTGAISSIGVSGDSGESNAGGDLVFVGSSWTNKGPIALSGGSTTCSASGSCHGSSAGSIDAPGLHNSGAITVSGGSAGGMGGNAFGRSAGSIVLASNSGVVIGNGGSATTDGDNSAFAGSGAEIQFVTNSGAITANGGDATSGSGSAFAGGGGTIEGQDNTAPITLRSGTPSTSGSKFGSGGTATLVTNTACIDVSGAQGDGTVNGPNVCL